MKTGTLILLAALGIGGYLFLKGQQAKTPPPAKDDGTSWWEKLIGGIETGWQTWLDHQDDGDGGN